MNRKPLDLILPIFFLIGLLFSFSLTAEPEVGTNKASVGLKYFGETGCSHCDLFAENILPEAEKLSGLSVNAEYYDILSPEGYELCVKELEARNMEFTVFPVLIIGNNVYQGNSDVESSITAELKYYSKHGSYRPGISDIAGVFGDEYLRLSIIPVLVAGLVDGVNPCAFATMLFFLSWIAVRGGGRYRVLVTGIAFIGGIYIAYLLIGFGIAGFLRKADGMETVRRLLRYIFAVAALIFAALSVRDAFLAKNGKTSGMILQLPKFLKQKAHKVIRKNGKQSDKISIIMVFGFFITGTIVAVIELACTGQIYLPTIAYMVQSGADSALPFLWLNLYNAAFILPLFTLLLLVFGGMEQEKIRLWFSRHLFTGKLGLAGVFLMLSLLIWLQ